MSSFEKLFGAEMILIDLSYFIFHNYYAKKKYFEIQKKSTDDLIHNQEFLDVFSNFDKKLIEIKKKLKLKKDIPVIFAKDCMRCNIWRNSLFPDYKKSRKVDNEVGSFFKYTYSNIIDKYNYIDCNFCEADDIIGVITNNFKKVNNANHIYIITGDHDYMQLFDDDGFIRIYDLKCKDLKDKSLGCSKKDLLHKIIIGDKSDNIPPIHAKLGPKTALKYINNEDELKKKLKDPLIKKNFDNNSKLIDMNNIPVEYQNTISQKFLELWKQISSTLSE